MDELATLRIYRPWRLTAAVGAMVIEVDGGEVGRLRNGRNFVTHVEPGVHNLQVRQITYKSAPLEIVLGPGDDVLLETRYHSLNIGSYQISLVPRSGFAATPPVQPPSPPATQVLGITETHRSEEPIGTETRRIDNTSSPSRLTRTIQLTREWSRTVSLDVSSNHAASTAAQVGPSWPSLWAGVEPSLAQTYSISAGRREEFAEEISVEVDPGDAVTIILAWKRVWQHGVVRILFDGRQVDVPFQVDVGITFDQSGQ